MDKKKYQTPQLKEVKLSPEDAVLTGCKVSTGGLKSSWVCKGPSACKNNAAGS